MQILKLILLFIPISSFGQTNETEILSNWNIQDFSNSRFEIDINGFHGKKKSDTTHYTDGKIAAIGFYAVDKNCRISGNKIGYWTSYYPNGQVSAQGIYDMYSLLYYVGKKGRRLETSYKVGTWTYYYENGQIKAKGEYQIALLPANTGINGQASRISTTTDRWLFLNTDGCKATNIEHLIAEIEHKPNCD
jgi:hypothetical protein